MSLVWPSPPPIASSAFSMLALRRPATQPIGFFLATVVPSSESPCHLLPWSSLSATVAWLSPSPWLLKSPVVRARASRRRASRMGGSVTFAVLGYHRFVLLQSVDTPAPYAGCQIASHLQECFCAHAPLFPFEVVVGEIALMGPDFAQQLELGHSAYRRTHGPGVVAAFDPRVHGSSRMAEQSIACIPCFRTNSYSRFIALALIGRRALGTALYGASSTTRESMQRDTSLCFREVIYPSRAPVAGGSGSSGPTREGEHSTFTLRAAVKDVPLFNNWKLHLLVACIGDQQATYYDHIWLWLGRFLFSMNKHQLCAPAQASRTLPVVDTRLPSPHNRW
ncbi:hypothetical protein DFH06DRAFT_1126157 [Mycena polygramma]|nr:hypothetical protein DFH06DRAFT_1126157 [Mycena polygramma]